MQRKVAKMSNNPFKKLEKAKNQDNSKIEIDEKKFIANAMEDTDSKVKEIKKSKVIYIPQSLVIRLDSYSNTKATRKESQNYIINQALEEWLEKRGF